MSFIVDEGKCISDGACATVCPARIIRMDKGEKYPAPMPDFKDICIQCGHCVAICPK